ncbi:hypothetical protein [Aliikangiella sp. G2MR2-5]|uniref:hypothetical protein n=1 Tax=Aliikangiella sp. G2MR2-5 TaxID=2788943 RepID=UPI0018AC3958|nr:hypothetical protein [Aliikangiella sp. G2MR2-5]
MLLFIIVILGLLAATLVSLNSLSTQANAHQVISTRAFLAAKSGADYMAMRVFPQSGASSCGNTTLNFTTNGLNGCSASITCTAIPVGSNNYYQILSNGVCNAGQTFQASRTIEMRLKPIR